MTQRQGSVRSYSDTQRSGRLRCSKLAASSSSMLPHVQQAVAILLAGLLGAPVQERGLTWEG